jgi:hypothetical protein
MGITIVLAPREIVKTHSLGQVQGEQIHKTDKVPAFMEVMLQRERRKISRKNQCISSVTVAMWNQPNQRR